MGLLSGITDDLTEEVDNRLWAQEFDDNKKALYIP